MNLCYEEWIHEHYPTKESARNNCWSATKAMIEAFPELIQTRGWYGWTEYWWCTQAKL